MRRDEERFTSMWICIAAASLCWSSPLPSLLASRVVLQTIGGTLFAGRALTRTVAVVPKDDVRIVRTFTARQPHISQPPSWRAICLELGNMGNADNVIMA